MNGTKQDTIRVLQLCEHFGNDKAAFHGVARSFELWMPSLNQPPFVTRLCSRAVPNAAALERFRAIGIEPLSLGYHKFDPRNLLKLIQILRHERIDILHLHGYGACTWGRIAGRLLNIPAIVHERCNYGTVPWFQVPVERLLGPRTRFAFAVSESTRVFTVKKRFIPDDRVHLLYSGISLDGIPQIDAERRNAVRQEYGIEPGTFLFGVVSRLESHKGHADLLRAFVDLKEKMPHARLWVLGDGNYRPELEALCESLALEPYVTFLGYHADIWPLIQALDVQVFPSHREGTPNTLYEAMAVGNAVVASTADGQGEILTHEQDALMYGPGDVQSLVEHMVRLERDPELRSSLRAAAKQRIGDFDMAKTIDTIKRAYVQIMNGEL